MTTFAHEAIAVQASGPTLAADRRTAPGARGVAILLQPQDVGGPSDGISVRARVSLAVRPRSCRRQLHPGGGVRRRLRRRPRPSPQLPAALNRGPHRARICRAPDVRDLFPYGERLPGVDPVQRTQGQAASAARVNCCSNSTGLIIPIAE